jgi:protein-tyrosine phosphatase
MTKILFVCLGNICRSTMAEYVMRHMVAERGLQDEVLCDSAGTSAEEQGNPVHPGTQRVLARHGIHCGNHRARQMTRADYATYDLLVGMDSENVASMLRLLAGKSPWGWGGLSAAERRAADPQDKVRKLLDWSDRPRDIADPWYTHDFDTTFADVREGCEALLDAIQDGAAPPDAK